jgi:hypothetical protein
MEDEDLEIGIPRQVISLKSTSRSLRLFSCVLFLHNIIFIRGILLLSFSLEECIGYSVVQLFNPTGIVYYFCISILSSAYRLYLITNFIHMNPQYIVFYILSFLMLKSFFILSLLIFRDRLLQLDRNSLVMIRNIRYI